MAIKVVLGKKISDRGQVSPDETTFADADSFVEDRGHLHVQKTVEGSINETVAIFAPGKWESVRVEN